MTGFVEPFCRPVGLGVPVALAARGARATGILKSRSLGSRTESGRRRKGCPVKGLLVIEVGKCQGGCGFKSCVGCLLLEYNKND